MGIVERLRLLRAEEAGRLATLAKVNRYRQLLAEDSESDAAANEMYQLMLDLGRDIEQVSADRQRMRDAKVLINWDPAAEQAAEAERKAKAAAESLIPMPDEPSAEQSTTEETGESLIP